MSTFMKMEFAFSKRGHRELIFPICHVRIQLEGREESFQICWHCDLGLSNLQNCEQYISMVYKLLNLKYFVIAAGTE